jgi:hypothetical protein
VAASVTEASNVDDSIPVVEMSAVAANDSIADSGSTETAPTASIAIGTCPNSGAQIIQPEPGSKFSSLLVPIIGTASIPNFDHYKMEYSTNPNKDNWNYLLQKESAVENDVLMELNTSTIPYGPYGLRLTVVDLSGNYPEPCVVWFENASPGALPPASADNGPCSCAGDWYNCGNFATHSSAQTCFNYCRSIGKGDIHRLDRDNDEVACESLP